MYQRKGLDAGQKKSTSKTVDITFGTYLRASSAQCYVTDRIEKLHRQENSQTDVLNQSAVLKTRARVDIRCKGHIVARSGPRVLRLCIAYEAVQSSLNAPSALPWQDGTGISVTEASASVCSGSYCKNNCPASSNRHIWKGDI